MKYIKDVKIITESSAAVSVFVLHDDAVGHFSELLEVGPQGIVGGDVVQSSDEDLTNDVGLGNCGLAALLALGSGSLEVDLGAVHSVGPRLEAELCLVLGRVGDEPKAPVGKY